MRLQEAPPRSRLVSRSLLLVSSAWTQPLLVCEPGPGGFGTCDPADASDKPPSVDSRGNNSSYNEPQMGGGRPPRSSASNYSYNQQPGATPSYAPSSNQPQYAPQYSMPQSNGPPPGSSYGGGYDGMYGSNPTPYPDGRPRSSTSSRGSWGSQPPLTSSKRDQTWEAKRRLWAARRQQDGRSTSGGSSRGGNPYSSEGGLAPTLPPFYGHIPQNEMGPPSPLTKFMHQQQTRVDYERIGTAQSSTAASGGYSPNQYGSVQAATTGGATDYYAAPSSSYSGQMGQRTSSHGRASTSSYGGGPSCEQPPPPMSRAGLTSSSSNGGQTPGTAAYGRSSTRQPPGGHSNWSPFN